MTEMFLHEWILQQKILPTISRDYFTQKLKGAYKHLKPFLSNKYVLQQIIHPKRGIYLRKYKKVYIDNVEDFETALLNTVIEKGNNGWSISAQECYNRNLNCDGCFYTTFFGEKGICQMKESVLKLIQTNPLPKSLLTKSIIED